MKCALPFLLIFSTAVSLFAQNNMDDYIESEAKRYKVGGIAMLVGGTAMIGGGAAMISNSSKYSKAMGAVLTAAGIGIDVGGILSIRKSGQIRREGAQKALIISPNGVQFALRF